MVWVPGVEWSRVVSGALAADSSLGALRPRGLIVAPGLFAFVAV